MQDVESAVGGSPRTLVEMWDEMRTRMREIEESRRLGPGAMLAESASAGRLRIIGPNRNANSE